MSEEDLGESLLAETDKNVSKLKDRVSELKEKERRREPRKPKDPSMPLFANLPREEKQDLEIPTPLNSLSIFGLDEKYLISWSTQRENLPATLWIYQATREFHSSLDPDPCSLLLQSLSPISVLCFLTVSDLPTLHHTTSSSLHILQTNIN